VLAPFTAQLDEIPGVGKTGAAELITEIGIDMTRFPASGHLVSWAKFAPRARQSAGKDKPGTTGKGSPWIAGTLGEAVLGAATTKTFPGARYHRLARKRGGQRAIVATGRSILVIACQLLSDPNARFADLGPDWHDRIAPLRRNASSSPNSNACPARRSPSRRPPPNTCPPSPRLRRGAAACPLTDRFSIQAARRGCVQARSCSRGGQ
jgi:hypothetical protein